MLGSVGEHRLDGLSSLEFPPLGAMVPFCALMPKFRISPRLLTRLTFGNARYNWLELQPSMRWKAFPFVLQD